MHSAISLSLKLGKKLLHPAFYAPDRNLLLPVTRNPSPRLQMTFHNATSQAEFLALSRAARRALAPRPFVR